MKSGHDVCFVGLKCYDLLAGARMPRYLGGAEKQLVSLAQGLADRGLDVAFITFDHGQPDRFRHGNITVYKSFAPDGGLPVVRFFHPRTTLLWKAMKKANSRVYVQMGAGSETGRVALGCRLSGKPGPAFVFCAASDSDCDKALPLLRPLRERYTYLLGLRSADLVVSQTSRQRQMMQASFGLESVVVPMPCLGLPEAGSSPPRVPDLQDVHVLWVGRIIDVKRLEWLLEIADRCPEITFDVVGAPNLDSEYARRMRKEAATIPNVIMHGKVSDQELARFYRQAAVLCCTSVIEGFPTTFLEAWSHGLPVLTTFDPDGVVAKNKLGFVARSVDEQVDQLKYVLAQEDVYRGISGRVRQYYRDNYSMDAIVPQFEQAFEMAIGSKKGG